MINVNNNTIQALSAILILIKMSHSTIFVILLLANMAFWNDIFALKYNASNGALVYN